MSSGTSESASWSQLPDTAVINILSHLSPTDRARASATCQRWRACHYHPSFWRRVRSGLSAGRGCDPARCLLDRCGRFVQQLSVAVAQPDHRLVCGGGGGSGRTSDRSTCLSSSATSDGSGPGWLVEPRDLPKCRAFYRDLPRVFEGLCSSPGLESFTLAFFPQCHNCKCPLWPDEEFEVKMTEVLRKVIQASGKLKTLALGHGISPSSQSKFLKELSDKFAGQLRALHLPAFQTAGVGDPAGDGQAMASSLTSFRRLSVLTVNSSLVTDRLLASLASAGNSAALQHLNIVLGYGEDVPGRLPDDARWSKLTVHSPDLRVTLSAIVSNRDSSDELLRFLAPSLPLAALRVFVRRAGALRTEFLEEVAGRYCRSLCSLELHSERAALLYGNEVEADPFVILCWKCKKLSHIVITGYKLLACNILAVALLRGPSLTTLEVEQDLIYHYDEDQPTTEEDEEGEYDEDEDEEEDEAEEDEETPASCDSPGSEAGHLRAGFRLQDKVREISKSLKRPWAPVERRHMTLSKFLTQDLLIEA